MTVNLNKHGQLSLFCVHVELSHFMASIDQAPLLSMSWCALSIENSTVCLDIKFTLDMPRHNDVIILDKMG